MKKLFLLALLVATLSLLLTACSDSYTCDECLEYFEGEPREIEYLDIDMEVCPECYENLKESQDAFDTIDNW